MSTEQADIYDELLPKIGDWENEELWPDEKLGEHLLASALLYEAEKQALRLRAAVPQLPAAELVPITVDLGAIAEATPYWTELLQTARAENPANAIVQEAVQCAAKGDTARAGRMLRHYILDGVQRERNAAAAAVRRHQKAKRQETLQVAIEGQEAPAEKYTDAEKSEWVRIAREKLKSGPAKKSDVARWVRKKVGGKVGPKEQVWKPSEKTIERAISHLWIK